MAFGVCVSCCALKIVYLGSWNSDLGLAFFAILIDSQTMFPWMKPFRTWIMEERVNRSNIYISLKCASLVSGPPDSPVTEVFLSQFISWDSRTYREVQYVMMEDFTGLVLSVHRCVCWIPVRLHLSRKAASAVWHHSLQQCLQHFKRCEWRTRTLRKFVGERVSPGAKMRCFMPRSSKVAGEAVAEKRQAPQRQQVGRDVREDRESGAPQVLEYHLCR